MAYRAQWSGRRSSVSVQILVPLAASVGCGRRLGNEASMSLWNKLLKGRAAAAIRRERDALAMESRLVLEDRELYARIQSASPQQRLAVAVAVARWAVTAVHLREPTLDLALGDLAAGKPVSPALASAVKNLASHLDGSYLRLQEQNDEGGGVSEDQVLAAFSIARAADSVGYALSGDADEAAYEAIKATDKLPEVHAVVLSALLTK